VHIGVISIFPEMFAAVTGFGMTRRAIEQGSIVFRGWNPRDFTEDRHRNVDDRPYGGGPGMVMTAPPLVAAIHAAREAAPTESQVAYLSPQGRRLDDPAVRDMAKRAGLILLCGRYEGIDERVIARHVDEEWSLGDFVLSGGELAAMALMDALARHLPGVLGNVQSAAEDSFAAGLLDCGHYTRPPEFAGDRVPEVLLAGDHAAIRRWRLKESLARTLQRRPELLDGRELNAEQLALLEEIRREKEIRR
jgi:tRNA (guanine37-N1)-methyltransferase